MRMRFGPDDETAFFARRDELSDRFAGWLTTQGVPGGEHDADLLMDWKWGYGDGELDLWRVSDVQEFLFDWCPRKLSASPEDCAGIPASVAAFVEFLAHHGMLRGGDSPKQIRRHCERSSAAFVTEMGNPANFGMAKSLLGSVGGLEPDADWSPDGLAAMLSQLQELGTGGVLELPDDDPDDEPPSIGPVRMPSDDERLASTRAAPILASMRTLAGYCATPGRTLTAKGNLRLADARHLVAALQTGDDPTLGGRRSLRSAEDLPGLSWILDTATEAGVVRHHRGKLVAVARFAGRDDVSAHGKIVRAALGAGPARPRSSFFAVLDQIHDVIDGCANVQLFALLEAGGAELDALAGLVSETVMTQFPGVPEVLIGSVPGRARAQLERLATLGVVEISGVREVACPDCGGWDHRGGHAVLTAAGVHLAVELAREADIEVLERPDPTETDADTLVGMVGAIDEEQWRRDVADWFAARPDPDLATTELVTAATADHRETIAALAGLEMAATLGGDRAVEAVRAHLGGPHDGIVLNWLVDRSAIDPTTIDPVRFVRGLVDMLSAALDGAGPEEVVEVFSEGSAEQHLETLDSIWRLDHPRLAEVLEALGAHHPTKAVAKAARKALVRHRSMLADQRSSEAVGATRGRRAARGVASGSPGRRS